MTATQDRAPLDGIGPFDVLASCGLLFALAIAQPLLDLLGRNAEFFLARGAPTVDIVGLALVVTLVIPAVLALLAIGVGRVHKGAGDLLHGLILAVLGAVLAIVVIRRTPLDGLPGLVQIGIAAVAGIALVIAYRRTPALQSLIRWGSPVPILVLGLFLFASSTSQLLFGTTAEAAAAVVEVGSPAPIVFLVFDEFPVSSLMDGDGNLQENLYPNFAKLAHDGTWYRNAVTVHPLTQYSVPSIVTGLTTTPGDLPTLRDYPDNLFTLLDDSYEIDATEIVTRLCPESACSGQSDPVVPPGRRWRSLISDLRVVAGHLFLPEQMTTGLPAIDETWGDFTPAESVVVETEDVDTSEFDSETFGDWMRAAVRDARDVPIARFVDVLEPPGDTPTLNFLHAMIPHAPWIRLPSGQLMDLYDPGPAPTTSGPKNIKSWITDPWPVEQEYQLHLLQVQAVDTFVGSVIERLESLGAYDDTLIVVVADHGITIRPGMTRRAVSRETMGDIPPVPLFIKAPHQEEGGIDDYRAHTTDIVPTIADILDIELPWDADGVSLLSDERPTRTHSVISNIEYDTDGSEARDRAREKVARFGPEGPFGLAPPGHADLLGTPTAGLRLGETTEMTVELQQPERFDDVDTTADVLPAMVRGRLDGVDDTGDVVIAVALNDEIVAVTRSYVDGDTRFHAVLPPDALRDGANSLELFVVAGDGPDRTFHAVGGPRD